MKRIFIVILLSFFTFLSFSQSYTLERLKAINIYVFANYITWLQQDSARYFTIGILGNEPSLYNELNEVTSSKYLHSKRIKLQQYKKINEVKNPNLLYVSNSHNYSIENIYNHAKEKGVFLITDGAPFKYSMINFIYRNDNLKFEINEENIDTERFDVSNRLLAMIRSKEELKDLYLKTEEFLETQKNIVEDQKRKIKKQEDSIQIQLVELNKQRGQISLQFEQINIQRTQIDSQYTVLNNLSKSIKHQQLVIKEKLKLIQQQEQTLNEQESNIQQKIDEQKLLALQTHNQEKEIKENKILNNKLKEVASKQIAQIKTQRHILLLIVSFLFITTILAFFVYRGYKAKKLINDQLLLKNKAIEDAKEKIESQAQKLEISNKELEKLSIVASKTDNAVIIMNPKGDYEWVNDAFTRMYGYTVDELILQRGRNILNSGSNVNVKDLISLWFQNKETVSFESQNETRDGKNIWIQTTVTPILDNEGEISKLVAIDTDISMIKSTEKQLMNQIEKSDQLLLNILPKKVADELKDKGQTSPETFDNISVMFTDFVDFTKIVTSLEPQQLLNELNEIFTAFDDIIGKHKCERIKTIGDAYMAVCGMHHKVENNALNLTLAAIDILEYLRTRNKKTKIKWNTRVGLHTGKIVGGVVGVRKYIYDIFGDSINVAARMEQHSEPMRINMSQVTYNLIKDNISCIERDPILVKGKGKTKMYFVDKIKPSKK